jgi:phospholipid transport system substrate-binding protein
MARGLRSGFDAFPLVAQVLPLVSFSEMPMKRIAAILVALTMSGSAAMAFGATTAPDALVNSTVEDVLATIKQTRDKRALYKLAEEKVLPMFDFRAMTQSAMGKHWRDASPAQQQALENGFRTVLVNTYVSALAQSDAGNSRVEVKPVQMPAQGSTDDVTVKTLVKRSGSAPMQIDYRLRDSGGAWKVNDVVVEQLSLISIYRESFADAVNRSGIDGLIKMIDDKNRKSAGA